jgi:hypothetical protein
MKQDVQEVAGTGSGLCPVAGFRINSSETSSTATRVLITLAK